MHEPDIRAGSNTSTRGFESHQNALQNYINIMNQGAQNQMNLIANIQHRNHERDQAKKRMEFEDSQTRLREAGANARTQAEIESREKVANMQDKTNREIKQWEISLEREKQIRGYNNTRNAAIESYATASGGMDKVVKGTWSKDGKTFTPTTYTTSDGGTGYYFNEGEESKFVDWQKNQQNPQGTTIAEQTTLNPTPTGALTPTNPNEQNKDPKNLLPTQRT